MIHTGKFILIWGTNLAHYMLYEPTSSDNKDKEKDNIGVNRPINLKILKTNMEIFLCGYNVHRRGLHRLN